MIRKDLKIKCNGRSADFIIPSFVVGCNINCAYCYVKRHRDDFIIYDNLDSIIKAVINFSNSLEKKMPNQCGNEWTFDIGESSDVLQYNVVEATNYIIDGILSSTKDIKLTFATKLSHPKNIEKIKYKGSRLRIRSSISTPFIMSKVENKTCKLQDRINGINKAIDNGWEVHLNFSPIIIYDNWVKDYYYLLKWVDSELREEVKSQLKAEVIFLTHHEKLHLKNASNILQECEDYLWTPSIQELKINNRKDNVLRYLAAYKNKCGEVFRKLLEDTMPYCEIRYMF